MSLSFGELGQLQCAHCGETYTHHDEVIVYEREQEDAYSGLRVSVRGMYVNTDSDVRRNPSSRRDGVIIKLWCECCGRDSELHVSQHKGATYLELFRVALLPALKHPTPF